MAQLKHPPIDPGSGTFGRRHSVRHIGVAPAEGHSTVKGYLTGFVLSVILTAIPFAMVMFPSFSRETIFTTILVMAVVQIFVHVIYFLHMDSSAEQRWNLVAFAFTLLITIIVVAGSVWIMRNATTNMMQHHIDSEAVVPQR